MANRSELSLDTSAAVTGATKDLNHDSCISPPVRSACEDDEGPLSATSQNAAREASYASLKRAIDAAEAARAVQHRHQMSQPETSLSSMPPPPQPATRVSMPPPRQVAPPTPTAEWAQRKSTNSWAPHQTFVDNGFDFGFDDHLTASCDKQTDFVESVSQPLDVQSSIAQPMTWHEPIPTPTALSHNHFDASQTFTPPEDLQPPVYPGSRRGSGAESLTANFDHFDLTNDSPQLMSPSMASASIEQPDGQLDLAARRKRPRPAALNGASLRSRSYGQMSSMSPTFRPGMTPPAHTVRHVKSTGHSLNAHYSGIRKMSAAGRSPINVSTFAEAEAFNRLMAAQAAAAQENTTPVPSPGHQLNSNFGPDDDFRNTKMELANRYQLPATQHLTLATASPPRTPFAAEYLPPGLGQLHMPPVSAPPQYATFPDYTPPYSAGPLTNSSWSDAPLTSPDVPNFPPVTYIPSIGHAPKSDSISGPFQQFMLPSDNKLDFDGFNMHSEQKKTEFFIQEFPNQREEHAHVAQQLAQSKPKAYVFANTAPSDYDQT